MVVIMAAASQRPLVARLLALEPLTVGNLTFTDVDSVLDAMNDSVSPEEIVIAFRDAGIAMSITTLYRWKANGDDRP